MKKKQPIRKKKEKYLSEIENQRKESPFLKLFEKIEPNKYKFGKTFIKTKYVIED